MVRQDADLTGLNAELSDADRMLDPFECKSAVVLEQARAEGRTVETVNISSIEEGDVRGLPNVPGRQDEEEYWREERTSQDENLADLARVLAEGDAAAKRYLTSVFASILLIGMFLIVLIGLFAAAV